MELRDYERPEPSHIHIPRPSRVAGQPAQLNAPELLDVCALLSQQDDNESLTSAD